MKLHLPKVLFTAVVAAVCCVQQAMAAVETKTYTINGESVDVTTYTGTENNMNPNRALTAETAENIIAFETTGGYFIQNGFETDRDIYISKGGATGDTKTGLVLNNGWGGNVYTFTGNVYGDGDIYKYGNPPGGVTLKFAGDMSSFTGRIITEGADALNKLIFEEATTGTGSISSNGTVSISSTTINNSSITSTRTITLDGATVNSAVEMSATGGIILQSKLNTSGENAHLTIKSGTTVTISLADAFAGKFNGEVGYDQGDGVVSTDKNGYFCLDGFSVCNDSSKVTLEEGATMKILNIDVSTSTNTETYSIYGIAEDTVYSTSEARNATSLILDNGAKLTLDGDEEAKAKELYVVEQDSVVEISGKDTVLNLNSLTVADGASLKVTGDGQYVLKTQSFASGVSLGTKDEWTGTVVYSFRDKGDTNLSTKLADLANENSSLVLSGAKGYFSTTASDNKLLGRTLELKDNGTTAALEICNGTSRGSYEASDLKSGIIYADLTGTGTIQYTFYGSAAYSKLDIKGDISGWSGTFEYTQSQNLMLTVTDKADVVNAAITKSNANGKLDLVVDNSSKTTTFNNTVNATSVTTTAGSSVKLGKGGDMTTGSFSLGDGGTLTLAGGTLTVTDSITLSTVTVDFSQYFDANQLVKTLVTADGGINDWAGDLAGAYTAGDGTEYTTSVKKDGNSIVLTFKGPESEFSSLTVDELELSLDGTVLTLYIGKDLTGMTGDIDLTLSDSALDTLADLPAGEVNLLLQGIAGSPIDSRTYGDDISFYGSYVGEVNGMYKVEYIPEPATATLSLLALAGLAARRRRR